ARRLAVHFGVFAPWDSENIPTKTAMHDVKEGDDLIAIYDGWDGGDGRDGDGGTVGMDGGGRDARD
ncbi:unnamed protein product, partial [Effrenium voratum]